LPKNKMKKEKKNIFILINFFNLSNRKTKAFLYFLSK